MSTDSSLDIDHLRQWIGREETVSDIVSADLARKFHATLALPGDAPRLGQRAPRILHFCLAQPAVIPAGLGRDGHPARGGFLPPVGLPRRMWAGGDLIFHDELTVGDVATRTSRIADVVMKAGRTGPLCFVTVEHRIAVGDRPILDERQDIVYRGDEAGNAKTTDPAPQGAHTRAFDTSSTTLFRYSALTFNGHRIHYDRRYAIDVEGYGGLVVHGPLQATLLHNFAAELKGAPPRRFSFRGLSPLIDDDACLLHAEPSADGLTLWTARAGGPIAMRAEAAW